MRPMDQEMRQAADACLDCHRICLTTFSQHCLTSAGGTSNRGTRG